MSEKNQRHQPPIKLPTTAPVQPVAQDEKPEETRRAITEIPAPKREPVLAVGRIVLYVLKEAEHLEGQIRPAIVTRTWSKTCAQLTVFPDGSNDFPVEAKPIPAGALVVGQRAPRKYQLQFAVSSANLDQDEKKPGTFHFPEID